MNNLYNVIAADAPIVQLGDSGTQFKKQLIRFGDWIDPIFPEDVMTIDRIKLEYFVQNFKNKVIGRVPLPLTHTDNPEYNTGELVDLVIEGDGSQVTDGLYGILDVRRPDVADDIKNELIWDVSISFTDNYQDNETGALYGPTLLHVALVNNPYIKKMNPFTALAESLSKQFGGVAVHMLSESASKEIHMTMQKVKNDREFAVELSYTGEDGKEVKLTAEPGAEVEVPESAVAGVTTMLAEATAPETAEQKAARETEAAAQAEKEAEEQKALSDKAGKLERELAETKAKLLDKEIDETYDTALKAGKIVPAQKDAFIQLSQALHGQTRQLSDGKTQNLSELLAEFVSKAPKVVSLDEENGKTDNDETHKGPIEKLPEESKRGLSQMGVSEEEYAKFGANESVSISKL